MSDFTTLETILGYRFDDQRLLRRALTHTSMMVGGTQPEGSYERLEFLGDRVLGLVMAQWLLETFPDENEGAIAKRLAALVCGDILARIADGISVGDYIRMSEAEKKSGGQKKETILADCMEALIGAVYNDGGLDAAQALVKNLWGNHIHENSPPIDFKSALQEWVQGRGKPLPEYRFLNRTGPDHQPLFTVECSVKGELGVTASGDSKKAAEKLAAEKMLKQLESKATK